MAVPARFARRWLRGEGEKICERVGRRAGGLRAAFSTSARVHAEVEITIDGKKVMIEQGAALIQACEKAGVQIPRFCYHDKLRIAGNCRMCLVELERSPKPVASCAMPVMPGMNVKTNTPLVHRAREGVMEFLLANHPVCSCGDAGDALIGVQLDCPICDQGGECDLQEQSLRYGSDRSRFFEVTGKRAVEDKDLGPLVKTSMNRCIHCTRCVRFANEVAGAPELGTTGRGTDMQIGTYIERALETEMSGNVIDLCPVGALTSKPYSFRARPWELKKTETIDVHDALGCNIRVDTKGIEVVRVLPRLNDDINEEWIDDKTRFACDGLKVQRLATPLVRHGERFEPASWAEALETIAENHRRLAPKGDEHRAIAGELADVESLVALKDLMNRLGSENLAVDQPNGGQPLPHGVDIRSNYLFNSTVHGVEEADAILIVGSNPRHEAAVLNTRLRKRWLNSDVQIGLVGAEFDSTFGYQHLGETAAALKRALSQKGGFGDVLKKATKPMVIVGSVVAEHPDGRAVYELIGQFVLAHESQFLRHDWNGYNVLQRAASRAGCYDIGFVTHSAQTAATEAKFLWLLGADEIAPSEVPRDAFVVYQGHHGDRGAQFADVVLPGFAYTEKSSTYVNTEGRTQTTSAATSAPGAARDDWAIVRAASEYLDVRLPYDDQFQMRARVCEIAPHLARFDVVEPSSLAALGLRALVVKNQQATRRLSHVPLATAVHDFYQTNAIARASLTMSRCTCNCAARRDNDAYLAQARR